MQHDDSYLDLCAGHALGCLDPPEAARLRMRVVEIPTWEAFSPQRKKLSSLVHSVGTLSQLLVAESIRHNS